MRGAAPSPAKGVEIEGTYPLPAGRRLGFVQVGEGKTTAVLLHGVPGSRFTFRFTYDAVLSRGWTALVPDRPGYGLSDPSLPCSLRGVAADLAHWIDSRRPTKVVLVGVSGGGPYALALALALADLPISRIALVSSMGPIDERSLQRRVEWWQRLRLHLVRDVPGFASLFAKLAQTLFTRLPAERLRRLARRMTRSDPAAVDCPAFDFLFGEPMREAFRRGSRGVADDLRTLTRPWDFPVEEVRLPVVLWHGTEDRHVPLVMAEILAERLPNADLRPVLGADHFWFVRGYREVFADLAGSVGGGAPAEC